MDDVTELWLRRIVIVANNADLAIKEVLAEDPPNMVRIAKLISILKLVFGTLAEGPEIIREMPVTSCF